MQGAVVDYRLLIDMIRNSLSNHSSHDKVYYVHYYATNVFDVDSTENGQFYVNLPYTETTGSIKFFYSLITEEFKDSTIVCSQYFKSHKDIFRMVLSNNVFIDFLVTNRNDKKWVESICK